MILWIAAVVLVMFWVLGLYSPTFGVYNHILLVAAVLLIGLRLFQGRKLPSP